VLASGSGDKTVKLWDVASGRELRTLSTTDNVNGVAFSPADALLSAGCADGTIKIWDATSGRELRTLKDRGGIISLAFLMDQRTLVSSSAEGTVLWDVASGRELHRYADGGPIAVSPDGQILATGSPHRTVKLWDVVSGRELRTLSSSDAVSSVQFSPDGKILASGGYDHTVKLWDVASGRALRTVSGHSNMVYSVAFAPDGHILASGSTDGIKLWDVASGLELRTIGADSIVWSVAFSPQGGIVASPAHVDAVSLWDVASGGEVRTLSGHSQSVHTVAFAPDGHIFAANHLSGPITLWDPANGRELRSFGDGQFDSFAFSPDGSTIASGSGGTKKKTKLWDPATGREVRTFDGLSYGNWTGAFSPNGRIVAVGSFLLDHKIGLWDASSGRELRTLAGQSESVTTVAFSHDGRTLASNGDASTIKLWDVASGRALRTLSANCVSVESLAFSPDGRTLAFGCLNNDVQLWDASTGREIKILTGHEASVRSVAFSPDGRVLASGSDDDTIKVWDVANGDLLRTLQGHLASVTSIAFSPDSVVLASGSRDGTVKFWDARSGSERASLVTFGDGSYLAITPEGFYDASSKAAEEKLNVRIGNRVFPIAAYRERFYRPDLVKLSLAGNSLTKLGFASIDSVKVAPRVELVDLPPATSEPKLTMNIRLTDGGGGIGRVVLFHNGTAVQDSPGTNPPSQPGTSITRSFTVGLVDGPNVLQVEAYNAANTMRSDSAISTVAANLPPKTRSSLHAVVVGIQEFKNPNLNLAYPVKDARLFADTLSKYSAKLFQNIDVKLLITPADTTRESLIQAFKDMQAAVGPDDLFVFYVASHGITDDAEFYLITSNVGSASTEHLRADAVSKEELTALVANIHATKKLIAIDTCHAEALGDALQVALLTRGLDEIAALKVLSRAVGTTVLAASTTTQQALEGYEDHGLFTYVVAQGLMGKGDVDQNGIVNTLALAHYVDANVPELAQQHFNHPQYPTVETNGQAFPLTKVR